MMKFYDCQPAPSPRRARMVIAEKGIAVETVAVDLRGGAHLAPGFLALNPKATVPTLVLEDGTALTEALAIMQYLDEAHPEPNLGGRDAKERAQILTAHVEMERDGFMAIAECFRNSSEGFRDRALTGPANVAQIEALAERGRARYRRFLEDMDRRLSDRPFVAGERFTLADVTGFVAVEFGARAIKEAPPEGAAHLKRWRDTIAARPSASV
ncbi:MAG: glutathione S-transferase family protein [Pseudomonadota bacterium]